MTGRPRFERDDRVPPVVRRLGWVSFFTDAAGELIYPLIPLFLTVTLHASAGALGVIEGLADGLSTGLKAVSGTIADRVGHTRAMVVIGYGLGAISKPLMALAPNWGVVAALRSADRTGKGIRSAPRDVIISQATAPEHRGRSFGYHRAMDTAGAVVGPLVAAAALAGVGPHHLRPVLAVALLPGLASLCLLRRVPSPPAPPPRDLNPRRLAWRGGFGWFVAVTAVFGLVNSSDAFLLLRAHQLGLSAVKVVLAYAVFNLVYAAASLPAGIRADRRDKLAVYGAGLGVFAVVYAGFGAATTSWVVWPLMATYGLYMALTTGVGRAIVADLVPAEVRGTALGVTEALGGAGALIAGIVAGVLWDAVSPAAPFYLGAAGAVAGLSLLVAGRPRIRATAGADRP